MNTTVKDELALGEKRVAQARGSDFRRSPQGLVQQSYVTVGETDAGVELPI